MAHLELRGEDLLRPRGSMPFLKTLFGQAESELKNKILKYLSHIWERPFYPEKTKLNPQGLEVSKS